MTNKQKKYMTVIEKHTDGTLVPVMLDLHEVDYIESENRRLVYYVGEKKYYQITKLQEMQALLDETDSFISLDRINLVNLKKVTDYDENLGIVYFDQGMDIKKRSFTTIAKLKQKIFSPLIYRAIAKNLDKQIMKKFTKEKKHITIRQQEND